MSKVITFSRYYPKGHPRAGEQTNFVEKIWSSLIESSLNLPEVYIDNYVHFLNTRTEDILLPTTLAEPKGHTIRSGNRWKVGDKFSPRVWGNDINPKSGRSGAYQSKQITIAPDIEIKKIWNVAYHAQIFFLNENIMSTEEVERLAKNDGLTLEDLYSWFDIHPKAKKGITHFQILCWNESINY